MSKTFNPEGRRSCKWQQLPDGRFQCESCRTIRKRQPVRICRTESEQAKLRQESRENRRAARLAKSAPKVTTPPGKLTKATHWLTALARWLWESYKARRLLIRSEAEYRRVRRICESCEEWNTEKEACKVCGCGGRSKVVLLNKLKLTTEKCPRGKW